MTEHSSRVAVIGCGYWGRNLVRVAAELGVLAAVHDPDPEVAAEIGQRHDAPALAWADILDRADVDAVLIAAPASLHASLALEAIEAGKHVFVEKPLALDPDDGERVCVAAEAAGVTLMVGHLLQYHPVFLALARLVRDGELGKLRYLYSNRLNLGKVRREENILWSFAPHDLSMILSLVGEEPTSVTAVGGWYLDAQIADVTTTHLEFPGGVRAHVFVSWLHPVKEQRLVVVGDDAMAIFDDTQPWDSKLALYRHRVEVSGEVPLAVRGEPEWVTVDQEEPLAQEIGHFLGCLASGERPRTDGREGLRVLRVLHEAEIELRASRA